MPRLTSLLSISFCLCSCSALFSHPLDVSGTISARTEFKSRPFDLRAGDRIEISAGRSALQRYIYNASNGELVALSSDAERGVFTWSVALPARYYVVLRNSGAVSAAYAIRFSTEHMASHIAGAAPNAAQIRLFYATDRTATGGARNQVTFGGEAASRLQFGECVVSVPRSHRMGELEGPSIWRLEFRPDPSRHVVLTQTIPEDSTAFFAGISERSQHSTAHDALVFVHGFNTTFEDAARRAGQIAYDLAFEGAILIYSWPSEGRLGLVDYNRDGRNAELSIPHFAQLIEELAAQPHIEHVHILAHSMGNRIVAQALATLPPVARQKMRQIALLAPDIDTEVFRRLAGALASSADHVTLYASERDGALKISEHLAGYPRAGEGAPHLTVVPGIDTVDASAVDTSALGLNHSYFADNRTILSDLFYLLRNALPPQRAGLQARQSSAGSYWAFVPAIR